MARRSASASTDAGTPVSAESRSVVFMRHTEGMATRAVKLTEAERADLITEYVRRRSVVNLSEGQIEKLLSAPAPDLSKWTGRANGKKETSRPG